MSTAITGSPLPSTCRLTIVRVRTRRAKQIQERLELVHGLEEESHVWTPERGQEREPGLLKIPDRPEMYDTVGRESAGQDAVERRRADVVQRGEHRDAQRRDTVQHARPGSSCSMGGQLGYRVRATADD